VNKEGRKERRKEGGMEGREGRMNGRNVKEGRKEGRKCRFRAKCFIPKQTKTGELIGEGMVITWGSFYGVHALCGRLPLAVAFPLA
jgi:hypothetical protein